jgi:hypothetical protein
MRCVAWRLLLVWHVGARCEPDDCCWRWHKMCARRLLLALAEDVCQAIAMQKTDIILVVFKADIILVIFTTREISPLELLHEQSLSELLREQSLSELLRERTPSELLRKRSTNLLAQRSI